MASPPITGDCSCALALCSIARTSVRYLTSCPLSAYTLTAVWENVPANPPLNG